MSVFSSPDNYSNNTFNKNTYYISIPNLSHLNKNNSDTIPSTQRRTKELGKRVLPLSPLTPPPPPSKKPKSIGFLARRVTKHECFSASKSDLVHQTNNLSKEYQDLTVLTKSYEEEIKNHFQERIKTFFMQLVICYQTGFEIGLGKTEKQGSSGTALFTVINGSSIKICSRHAAHDALLPNLIVDPQNENYPLLRGSIVEESANNTHILPRLVNEVDSLVEKNFRSEALMLLNLAASNQLNPTEGLKKFSQKMSEILNSAQNKVKSKLEKELIVTYYKTELQDVTNSMEEKPAGFFSRLLNFQTSEKDIDSDVFLTLSQIRYRAIKDNCVFESRVKEKIEGLAEALFDKKSEYLKAKKALYNHLIKNMPDGYKSSIQILLNYNGNDLRKTPQLNKYETACVTNQKIITSAINEIVMILIEAKNKEIATQTRVSQQLKRVIPALDDLLKPQNDENIPPNNAAALSKVAKPLEREQIIALTSQLKIDPVFYFPQSFYQ